MSRVDHCVDTFVLVSGIVKNSAATIPISVVSGHMEADGIERDNLESQQRKDDPADEWFPESVAADYDLPGGANAPDVIEPVVELLSGLAGNGPVLEFAVGTGRIAAPLAARGVEVKGIELSRAMAPRVVEKPGGNAVDVAIGDMTTTRVAGEFSLVYLVFNTISNLTTQDEQVAAFCNASAHLRPGGFFLIEDGLPDLRRLPPGQNTVPFSVLPGREGGGYVGFDQYDVVTQRFTSNHVSVSADGSGSFRRIPFRFAWPAEMDLMARIAGMKLKHRWSGWDRSELTEESTSHVSVWVKSGSTLR
ncbi:methyltransferase domain-containing protein [Spelaeicoccus albus]|uniref:SAM-dependent methyltransferase n=1 Tax=Spelaeicoccus albus TaxID=1280376 RepID=A0A7Z0D5U7_9MICO|nr:class I SAM-dependent methyltransferase [Spelaeicoccus albus]NYI69413.1 SAM-dependent methyltransferase [Spelaeicoccus albus]